MHTTTRKRPPGLIAASLVAIVFGLMTLKEGGLTLFGPPEYAEAAGDYVPFVLWFNFIAGFFYIAAGVLLYRHQRAGAGLALLIALMTLMVFAGFGVHILGGGAYEQRTLIAMTLRSTVWIVIAIYAYRSLLRGRGADGSATALE